MDASGEYLGLPAAFLLAGASRVISSLWAIQLTTPLLIMQDLYNGIYLHGKSAATALREATLRLRSFSIDELRTSLCDTLSTSTRDIILKELKSEVVPPSHPYHWAPFIVCGAPWTVDEIKTSSLKFYKSKVLTQPNVLSQTLSVTVVNAQTHEKTRNIDDLISKARFQDAIDALESASKETGPTIFYEERLGSCYAEIGKIDESVEHYRRFLEYDRNNFLGYYNLGCVYRDFGFVQQARECFNKTLMLNPAYSKAMSNLSELTNSPDEAISLLRRVAFAEPDDADVTKVIEMWKDLSKYRPVDIIAHRLMWSEKALKGDRIPNARMHLAMAREGEQFLDDEAKACAFCIQSNILRRQDLIEDSVRVLEKAVALDPCVASYWNNLGARRYLLVENQPSQEEKEKLIKAEKECMKAIELHDYARPHQNLGSIYEKWFNLFHNKTKLDRAKEEASKSLDMAERQLRIGSNEPLVCKGCPTQGKISSECQQCREKAQNLIRDIHLADGDYRIE